MLLITRKSECKNNWMEKRALSQKDAIRRTFGNYQVSEGLILRKSETSYVSKNEIVINGVPICDGLSYKWTR